MLKKYQLRLIPVFFIAFMLFQEGGRNIGVLANMPLVSDYYKNPYSVESLAPYATVPLGDLLIIMGVGAFGGLIMGFGLSMWLNRKTKVAWAYSALLLVALMVEPFLFPGWLLGSNGVFSIFGLFNLSSPIYNILIGIFLLFLGSWILLRWGRSKPLTEINHSESNRTFA